MSRNTFGKVRHFQPTARVASHSDATRTEMARFSLWVAAGLLTGFIAAAIECL